MCDRASLDHAIANLPEGIPPVRGVFHAAGVLRDGYLREKTEADVLTVMRPKVAGLMNLLAATSGDEVAFVALCSSLAALGNPGQADYAGANAWLDAVAGAASGPGQRRAVR